MPIISLDPLSVFDENASWLLQLALDSEKKADSLYEQHEDKHIVGTYCKIGVSKEEIFMVRLRERDSNKKDVIAVGTTGKRSAMVSLVVALALHDMLDLFKMEAAWAYRPSLQKAFLDLIENATNYNGGGPPAECTPGPRSRSSATN